MVSLEGNSAYRQKLISKPIVNAFVKFIEDQEIIPANCSQLDKVLFNAMVAFKASDKDSFEKEYVELSRREPSPTAPYAYNDFLIFILICGVGKFGLNQDWINRVLDIRNCSDDECKLTTLTFKNILSENYSSTNNHLSTVITFQYVLEIPLLENHLLNMTYLGITQSSFPKFNSDFLNLVSLRAFDVIILRKEVIGGGEVSQLKEFEKKFNSRVSSVSLFFHVIIVIGIYFLIIYFYFINKSFQDLIKPHLGLFNALGGGGLVVMFFFTNRLTNTYERFIKRFWGYRKRGKPT